MKRSYSEGKGREGKGREGKGAVNVPRARKGWLLII